MNTTNTKSLMTVNRDHAVQCLVAMHETTSNLLRMSAQGKRWSKIDLLSASKSNSSEIASLKLRSTQRGDYDSPRIFESKITWG